MPPNYPAAFTGAATFNTTQGSHSGGNVCLIKLPSDNQAYLASSRQLLGFHGGFTDQIDAKNVPNAVQGNAPQTAAVVLADKPPAIGDVVWMIALLRNGPPDKVAHRAQVLLLNDWVVIQFDDPDILTGGTLGSPVLNTDSQVIGVLFSSLTGGGNVRGYLIPAALLAKTIQTQK